MKIAICELEEKATPDPFALLGKPDVSEASRFPIFNLHIAIFNLI